MGNKYNMRISFYHPTSRDPATDPVALLMACPLTICSCITSSPEIVYRVVICHRMNLPYMPQNESTIYPDQSDFAPNNTFSEDPSIKVTI